MSRVQLAWPVWRNVRVYRNPDPRCRRKERYAVIETYPFTGRKYVWATASSFEKAWTLVERIAQRDYDRQCEQEYAERWVS